MKKVPKKIAVSFIGVYRLGMDLEFATWVRSKIRDEQEAFWAQDQKPLHQLVIAAGLRVTPESLTRYKNGNQTPDDLALLARMAKRWGEDLLEVLRIAGREYLLEKHQEAVEALEGLLLKKAKPALPKSETGN